MKGLFTHKTKREEVIKFFLLLAVFLAYFAYLSWEYDLATGGIVAGLSWSFFVLCTPVADAGFLLDFPVRLITGIRMVFLEIGVWAIAVLLNVLGLEFWEEEYGKTFLTSLLHKILVTPWPYWCIVVLCCIGTFVSIRFGDELLDVATHKERALYHAHGFKYRLTALAAFFALIFTAYYFLLNSLGIEVPSSG
ncbi:MAG: hypothetical protein H6853_06350 [Rhodospirillales bacterium]|nr:hypothetical protein [Alphaproteobacteria bacterium]USO03154.1 MAG: hypothetical protein H6853_06350 [Rhodospirillales bacterium]